MKGRISAFQSMGAVDGPGVRCVVFMQGCPLRCVYCHNPETWERNGGFETDTEELVRKILRYKSFISRGGGVTISGGEPLIQPEFCRELFRRLKAEGIHTALDTSGIGDLQAADTVLEYTDLVLCDVKFHTERAYKEYCGGSFRQVEAFLELVKRRNVALWFRHVVVPGITDSKEEIQALHAFGKGYPSLERIELLPFQKMCMTKYEKFDMEFPLKDVPVCDPETIETLKTYMSDLEITGLTNRKRYDKISSR